MYTSTADSGLCRLIFIFAYSHKPLSDTVDIYFPTALILCNSINYNPIDTKLGTMVHLLIHYQPPELYGQKHLISVLCSIVLIVNMIKHVVSKLNLKTFYML